MLFTPHSTPHGHAGCRPAHRPSSQPPFYVTTRWRPDSSSRSHSPAPRPCCWHAARLHICTHGRRPSRRQPLRPKWQQASHRWGAAWWKTCRSRPAKESFKHDFSSKRATQACALLHTPPSIKSPTHVCRQAQQSPRCPAGGGHASTHFSPHLPAAHRTAQSPRAAPSYPLQQVCFGGLNQLGRKGLVRASRTRLRAICRATDAQSKLQGCGHIPPQLQL